MTRKIWLMAVLSFPLSAGTVYQVSLDTTPLRNSGNYYFDFLLLGTAGNTVVLNNFQYGSGSGDTGPVTLSTTSQFFNEAMFSFTPGLAFSFELAATTLPPLLGHSPDEFSFFVLTPDLNPIPTTDGAGALLVGDIIAGGPVLQTFTGTGIALVPQATVIPEPGTWMLLGAGLLAVARRRHVRPGR